MSEKKLLLSGGIELNPGPAIMPDLLNIRLLRWGLIPLDVGGSGDCFFNLYRISYMETRVITWRSELQVLSI